MRLTDFLPFQQAPSRSLKKKAAVALTPDDKTSITRFFKVGALALGFTGIANSGLTTRTTFEDPEYDFDRIIQAIDTDSYTRQAFAKYKELMWKEGWEIVGENPDAVNYLWQRIDFLEIAMKRPFTSFLAEVADQLVKFSNVFIVRARSDDLKKFFPGKLRTLDGQEPIVGYYLIPAERVQIKRDKNNRAQRYKQRTDMDSIGTNRSDPTWMAKEVIHIHWDRKPGRIFGTPFMVSVIDDIVALRQIEEDIQNLIHRELFPLYKYQIGTDEFPATPEEVEKTIAEIESMRHDTSIIMPWRHDVNVVGADGAALDATEYLMHFKTRLAMGLGLYPHHLGMDTGSNRSATDRLDVALYDKVKTYQRELAEYIRMFVFDELLLEGGFNPYVNPKISGPSDRCIFRFREIDVDTQIKKETHIANLFAQNLLETGEARLELNRDPNMSEEETMAALQTRMMPDQTVQTKNKDGSPGAPKLVDTTPKPAQKPGAQAPSTGGRPNMRNVKKTSANIIRPTNQFGTRTSPNVRRSDDIDDDWLAEVENLLGDDVYLDESEGETNA